MDMPDPELIESQDSLVDLYHRTGRPDVKECVALMQEAILLETEIATSERQELQIESSRFTTLSALAREIEALLESTDDKLIVIVNEKQFEELSVRLEGWRTMGRLKVRRIQE